MRRTLLLAFALAACSKGPRGETWTIDASLFESRSPAALARFRTERWGTRCALERIEPDEEPTLAFTFPEACGFVTLTWTTDGAHAIAVLGTSGKAIFDLDLEDGNVTRLRRPAESDAASMGGIRYVDGRIVHYGWFPVSRHSNSQHMWVLTENRWTEAPVVISDVPPYPGIRDVHDGHDPSPALKTTLAALHESSSWKVLDIDGGAIARPYGSGLVFLDTAGGVVSTVPGVPFKKGDPWRNATARGAFVLYEDGPTAILFDARGTELYRSADHAAISFWPRGVD